MEKSNNYKEKKTSATQKLIDNTPIAKLKTRDLEIPVSETALFLTSANTVKTSVYIHTNYRIRHRKST